MNRITTLLSLVVLLASLEVGTAKVYEKCELVHELRSKGVAEKDLSDWVCLAWHESRYDTDAFGRLNWDGSVDHGLFQISDIYWCDWRSREPARHYKNVCGTNCDAFHDDDIGDDLSCVMQIFKEHERLRGNGFMAWAAWKTHCQHADTSTFTAGCDRAPAPTPRPDRPRPPSTHKSVQQHYQEPPHTNAHTHFNNLAPLANGLVRRPAANKEPKSESE